MDNDDEAARWAIRVDGRPLAPDEDAELEAWLAEDPRRRGALLRAEATLAYLDRGRALAHADDMAETSSRRLGRRALLSGGLVAGIAASLGAVWLSMPSAIQLQTAVGEIRRVPLSDGSVALINTDSRLAVTMQDGRRNLRLESGEAWFDVAHDRTRPFVVEAGAVRVRALGTAFSVRRRDGGADVLVTEGVVEVWIEGSDITPVQIAAGSKSFVAETANRIERGTVAEDVERALAWRSGELALNGESLAYAVAELNRYNVRKLRINDAALGRELLVGYFRIDQPEAFGRTIATMIGARVTVKGETIYLSR